MIGTGSRGTSARTVTTERWAVAQSAENRAIADADTVREWITIRRKTWPEILRRVGDRLEIGMETRILEIGGSATPFFLALQEGKRTAVDTVYQKLFQLYPELRDLPEYHQVEFISSRLEDLPPDRTFDLVILINMLDHVQDPWAFVRQIDRLLAANGRILIIVDTYADPVVRGLVRDSDVDIPHPHHFLHEDVLGLFPTYGLVFHDARIWTLYFGSPVCSRAASHIPLFRVDQLLARIRLDVREWKRKGDILYTARFILVYGLALLVNLVRRRDPPAHPLKKQRLYLFQRAPS
jgi:SAM-dependent methyltransferase